MISFEPYAWKAGVAGPLARVFRAVKHHLQPNKLRRFKFYRVNGFFIDTIMPLCKRILEIQLGGNCRSMDLFLESRHCQSCNGQCHH